MDKFPTSWRLLRAVLSVYVSVAMFRFRKSLTTKQWYFREDLYCWPQEILVNGFILTIQFALLV